MRYLCILLLLLLNAANCVAASCAGAYPGALQTHGAGNNKKIKFFCNAQLLGSTGLTLATKNLVNPGAGCALTCGSANCLGSGISASAIDADPFPSLNGAANITVSNGNSVTMGTGIGSSVVIKNLTLKSNSTVHFYPGDYWFNRIDINGNNVNIKVIGDGTVRIFVKKAINTNKKIFINTGSTYANPAKNLWIYGYNSIKFHHPDTQIVGVLYSKGKVVLGSGMLLTGAVSAKNMDIEANTVVTYAPSAVSELNFGTTCLGNNVVSDFELNIANGIIAGVSTPITITTYGVNGDTNAREIMTNYTGTKNLKFWYEYIDPSSGTIDVAIDEVPIGNGESNAVNINTLFNNGVAMANMKYRDVGKIQLFVKDAEISGSSTPYVVKPAKFLVTVPASVAASDHNSAIFKAAGEEFTIDVSVTDIDNNVTPNYGNELVPEGIVVKPTIVLPAGGSNGTITNNTSFVKTAPGVFQCSTCSFSEVGIIKLTAGVASGNYLLAGDVSGPVSGNIGRFIPYKFQLSANNSKLTAGHSACNFTYLKQKFYHHTVPSITVSARAKSGTITTNYTGNFWKLISSSLNPQYILQGVSGVAVDASDVLNNLLFVDNSNGTGTYTLGALDNFLRIVNNSENTADISPFDANINLQLTIKDTDNVEYKTVDNLYTKNIDFIGDKNSILHGRLMLENTHGPELLPLELPVKLEYYNGSDYVTNDLDLGCTSMALGGFELVLKPSGLNTIVTEPFPAKFILAAPGTPGTADITARLDLVDLVHLQYNGTNPTGRATFGIAKGRDAVIFMREKY